MVLYERLCTEFVVENFDYLNINKDNLNQNNNELDKIAHAYGVKNKFWEKHKKLTISIYNVLNESKILIDKRKEIIKNKIKSWSDICSISFEFLDNDNSNAIIRITFKETGSYSHIGTDNLNVDKMKETMNLHPYIFRYDDGTILHEFGHVLGLWHEHQHIDSKIQWNKQIIYDYYSKHFNWSKEKVDYNILDRYQDDDYLAFDYDEKSIMHYDFKAILAGKNICKKYLFVNW